MIVLSETDAFLADKQNALIETTSKVFDIALNNRLIEYFK